MFLSSSGAGDDDDVEQLSLTLTLASVSFSFFVSPLNYSLFLFVTVPFSHFLFIESQF